MVKNSNFRNRTIFGKYLEVMSERLVISMKINKEYKADFWSMMFFDIMHLVSMFIFYTVILKLTSDFLDWVLIDFFLFFMYNLLMWKFLWLHNLRNFNSSLLLGDLNIALVRPLNIYFHETTKKINWQNIISGIGMFFIIVVVSVIVGYSNFILAFISFLLGALYFMAVFNFFNSFYFFMKRIDFFEIIFRANSAARQFTPKAFEGTRLKSFFYLLPTSVCAFFTIEILKGNLDLWLFYLPFILLSLLILFFGTYLLWHFGLKRYEAYG